MKQLSAAELHGQLAALKFMVVATARAQADQPAVGREYDSLCTGLLDSLNALPASDEEIETVEMQLRLLRGLVWKTPGT